MFELTAMPRSPVLARFVASFHYLETEVAAGLERILPTGRIHLMVNLLEDEFRTYNGPDLATVSRTHGAMLAGPRSQSTVIDTREQRHLMIVDFKLGGAAPFFTLPLSETRDQLVDLDQLWGRDGGALRERLLEANTPGAKFRILEAILLDHLDLSEVPDAALPLAASALQRGIPVSSTASRLGILPKTFVRRFRKQTGLTPKRFARVRRLQRVLGTIGGSIGNPGAVDWAALAAEHGYADQAHLVHDFHDLTGITPGRYRPRSANEKNHLPITASRS